LELADTNPEASVAATSGPNGPRSEASGRLKLSQADASACPTKQVPVPPPFPSPPPGGTIGPTGPEGIMGPTGPPGGRKGGGGRPLGGPLGLLAKTQVRTTKIVIQ